MTTERTSIATRPPRVKGDKQWIKTATHDVRTRQIIGGTVLFSENQRLATVLGLIDHAGKASPGLHQTVHCR